MRAPSSSIWAVGAALEPSDPYEHGTPPCHRGATQGGYPASDRRSVRPTVAAPAGGAYGARGRDQLVRELAAEAGEVLGRQVVARVRVEQHLGLSRLLVVAGPDQHGDVDARQGDEPERRVAQRERVASGRAGGRPEGVEAGGRAGEGAGERRLGPARERRRVEQPVRQLAIGAPRAGRRSAVGEQQVVQQQDGDGDVGRLARVAGPPGSDASAGAAADRRPGRRLPRPGASRDGDVRTGARARRRPSVCSRRARRRPPRPRRPIPRAPSPVRRRSGVPEERSLSCLLVRLRSSHRPVVTIPGPAHPGHRRRRRSRLDERRPVRPGGRALLPRRRIQCPEPQANERESMTSPTRRRRRSWKKTLLWMIGTAIVLFVLIQFVPYGRTSHTNPPATNPFKWSDPQAKALAQGRVLRLPQQQDGLVVGDEHRAVLVGRAARRRRGARDRQLLGVRGPAVGRCVRATP